MVTVTAQDGTKKTYTINVTREAKTQEGQTPAAEVQPEEENTKNQRGLKKLEIPGITLSPIFKTSVYEYTAKYIGEETKSG